MYSSAQNTEWVKNKIALIHMKRQRIKENKNQSLAFINHIIQENIDLCQKINLLNPLLIVMPSNLHMLLCDVSSKLKILHNINIYNNIFKWCYFLSCVPQFLILSKKTVTENKKFTTIFRAILHFLSFSCFPWLEKWSPVLLAFQDMWKT